MDNKEEKLKNLLFGIINKLSKDADVYHHNGSLWLIHTVDRKWIVEFTRERTLWFNYNFFRSAFKFVSLDVNSNQHYVTEWFVSKFLNKPKVEETLDAQGRSQISIENAIENGVKHTRQWTRNHLDSLEDTIQNGVKRTIDLEFRNQLSVENTIQNGVKHTIADEFGDLLTVEDTIQNGVKDIRHDHKPLQPLVDDAIENGVKDTKLKSGRQTGKVEDTIQNGVKETYSTLRRTKLGVDDIIQNGVKETRNNRLLRTVHVMSTIINGVKVAKPMDEWVNTERIVDKVVKDGVKETQPLPAQDGNMDWGNYYHGKEDRTKPFNEYLDDAIRFGVKEVIDEKHHRTREVVLTIKDGVKETYDDCSDNIARVEGIIRVGKKLDKDGI